MPKTLPVDDAHLPRTSRRFPFRPANDAELPEVLADAAAAVGGAREIIRSVCRSSIPSWLHSMHLHDVVQEVSIQLIYRALPRYDARRRPQTKLSTYLYQCARVAALDQARRLQRRKNTVGTATLDADLPGPDRSADAAVEQLATAILARPDDHLTTAKLVAAVVGADRDLTTTEQAHNAGMTIRQYAAARHRATAQIRRLADDLEIP